MAEPYRKPALTFDQQIARLQAVGMTIDQPAEAARALAAISYYRLSAYWYPFRDRDAAGNVLGDIAPGTRFSQVLALYEFDRKLRLLVMDAIERVEVALRTTVTYHLGHRYGAFGHEVAGNFHPQFEHADWLAKLHEETSRAKDAFIVHFQQRYTGFPSLPIWMVTEVMSLGALSRLYRGMTNDDKRSVANVFHVHHKRLADWMHVLTYIRNVCAHHSRLWNRELAIRPDTSRDPQWSPPVTPRTDRIFYVLLMLRHLLRERGEVNGWKSDVEALILTVAAEPRWRTAMGLPENWTAHPVWA